jgi:preprotein translocase subunit SecA
MKEGEAIISPMVSRAIEKAQKRVEEQNFSSRKHVLEYDDIMNQQRTVVYGLRKGVLEEKFDLEFMSQSVKYVAETIALKYSPDRTSDKKWDLDGLEKELTAEYHMDIPVKSKLEGVQVSVDTIMNITVETVMQAYESKISSIPTEVVSKVSSYVYLQVIDQNWKDHLKAMDELQESVRLRGYGQRDPLQEYKKEAYKLFEGLMNRIEDETALTLIRMPAPEEQADYELAEPEMDDMEFKHPEAEQLGDASPVEKDGMIYHGSREEPQDQSKVQQVVRDGEKVGRNDPCPCGSGKKYKKCHGKS